MSNVRHLLRNEHTLGQVSLHYVRGQATSSPAILGIPMQTFLLLCAVIAIVAIVIICIVVAYRRRRTRSMYNQNPEQFPHLPDLGYFQKRRLNSAKLQPLIEGDKDKALMIEKIEEQFSGPYYKILFKGKSPQAVFFDHEQSSDTCYFQIEVFHLHGQIQIGFVQDQSFKKVQAKDQFIGASGVSLTTSGLVVANGENLCNYNWSLDYGDVIGIGITKETKKFMERRAWISKNGVLLNPPPAEEMDKWLATFNIDAEERQKFKREAVKERNEEVMDAEAADKAAQAEKLAFQREQTTLSSRRVSIKTFKQFKYYPVVYYQGQKGKVDKGTLVHMNVGGQIFRMQEDNFKNGILK